MGVGGTPFWFPVRDFSDDVGLWKNFRYLEDFLQDIRTNAGGGHATVIIAPETSSRALEADYLTDGTNDEVQIEAAFGDLPATGGSVVMLEGSYTLEADFTIPNPGADQVASVRWIGNGAVLDVNCQITIGDDTGSTDDFHIEIAHFSITRTTDLTSIMFRGRGASIDFHSNYVNDVAGAYALCGGTTLLDFGRWTIHSNEINTINLRKGGSGADDSGVFLAGGGGSRNQFMWIYGNSIDGVTYTAASGHTAHVMYRGTGEMVVFGNEIKNWNTINGDMISSAIYAFHNLVDGTHTDGDHNLALDDLTDATITSVADNEFLVYDSGGAVWQNEALDISLDPSPTLGAALDAGGFDINNGGVIFLTEQADAEADVAGKGQIWVHDDTPNTLYFTDDAGTDHLIEFDGHTHVEADVTDLGTYLTDVVGDTTPQLGGNLDVNGQLITSASNGDVDISPDGTGNVILGSFTFDADQSVGAGQDNYALTYDNGTGLISLEAIPGAATPDEIQTTAGPDTDDYWNIVEIDSGDSLIIQQWDNSAASMLERIEIVGKGTALTDEGDIKIYDLDGVEMLRWDESLGRWQMLSGYNKWDFAGGGSELTSVELINSYDADMKVTATGAAAAARDFRVYANDATPTEQLRFEIIGDGEMNFYNSSGTLITTLTELDDLTDGGETSLHSHAGGGGGGGAATYSAGHPFLLMGA